MWSTNSRRVRRYHYKPAHRSQFIKSSLWPWEEDSPFFTPLLRGEK